MTVNFERIERFLNYLLVFLLPTQIAFHFWPASAFVFGIRVDYLAPSVYLTDILFLILFGVWFSGHHKNFLSLINKHKTLILLFLLIAVINIVFSFSVLPTVYKWIKTIEMAAFAFYVWARRDIFGSRAVYESLYLSLIFFSLIGIAQFFKGGTLGGILYYMGERSFSLSTPGIALVSLWGRSFLRAYSTLPHPNAFAGFLGAGMLILWGHYSKKSFSKKIPGLVIISLGFLLTFSLAAFLTAILCAAVYWMYLKKFFTKSNLFLFVLAFFLVSLLLPVVSGWLQSLGITYGESVSQRLDLAVVSGSIISHRFLVGSGLNTFIIEEARGVLTNSHYWLLQPVHNIYLLVMSEVGIGGLLLLYFLFSKILGGLLYRRNTGIFLAVIFIMITGLFDHYWFTLQQNLLLLGLLIGKALSVES